MAKAKPIKGKDGKFKGSIGSGKSGPRKPATPPETRISPKTKVMEMDEWEEKFQPEVNRFDADASFQNDAGDGIMFETYGDELIYVLSKAKEKKVWTYVDTDNGGTSIIPGYHLVNRIGYFVTKKPYLNTNIEIPLSEGR